MGQSMGASLRCAMLLVPRSSAAPTEVAIPHSAHGEHSTRSSDVALLVANRDFGSAVRLPRGGKAHGCPHRSMSSILAARRPLSTSDATG